MRTTTGNNIYRPQTGPYHVPGIPAEKPRNGNPADKTQGGGLRKPDNGFLSAVFKPLHIGLFDPVFSEENYKYLYDSLKNYSRLLKREFHPEYDPFALAGLCDEFQEILPEHTEFRLAVDEEDLSLSAWLLDNRYDNQTLYFLPCGIIGWTEGAFRELLVSFFRLLYHKQKLNLITGSGFYEMMDEQVMEDEGQDGEWAENFGQYKHGYKKELLDTVSAEPTCSISKLRKLVNGFRPACKRESNLKPLLLEGLGLLDKKKLLLSYGVPPDGCYDYSVNIGEVIQITCDSDMLTEDYIRYLNEDAGNSGFDFISGGSVKLNPETKRLLKPDKFVMDFMNWLNKLNDELYHL